MALPDIKAMNATGSSCCRIQVQAIAMRTTADRKDLYISSPLPPVKFYFPRFIKGVPACWKNPSPLERYRSFEKTVRTVRRLLKLIEARTKPLYKIKKK